MFITLTIDTAQKKSHKVRLHKKKFNATQSWRRQLNIKKRGLVQRIKAWRRSLRGGQYKMDGQIAMF